MIKSLLKKWIGLADFIAAPLVWLSASLLKLVRMAGLQRLPVCKSILFKVGVLPIRDHYYEPLFNPVHLRKSLREDRYLPGIDFNIKEQLSLLEKFQYNEELEQFPLDKVRDLEFFYHNDAYESGDAEYLYNIIRFFKPRRIVEVGSGYSTLMAANALATNRAENEEYTCDHVCIEPYENSWLEKLKVTVIREVVEKAAPILFQKLDRNDILFIDSSHVIRPQGDVLCEYLEIMPLLKSGVLVHVHDIFTPKDYPDEWVLDEVTLWNEQYLLEAFLTFNGEFKVIGALNNLKHHHIENLAAKCPIFKQEMALREPGAFWLMRV